MSIFFKSTENLTKRKATKMTELEKIAYAKTFIEKLAQGISPLDNTPIPEGEIVNNVRLARCFFYVAQVLGRVCENGGIDAPKPQEQPKSGSGRSVSLTREDLSRFEYSDKPIALGEMHKRVIALAPQGKRVNGFAKSKLIKWLVFCGFAVTEKVDGKWLKFPTEAGEEIGISLGQGTDYHGDTYTYLCLNLDAQHFVLDNFEAITSFSTREYRDKFNLANQGQPWDKEQDERLVEMFNTGYTLSEIARELQRGEGGIKARLRRRGLR